MALIRNVDAALADAAVSMKSFRAKWMQGAPNDIWTKPQATQIDILSAVVDRLIDAVKELTELNR